MIPLKKKETMNRRQRKQQYIRRRNQMRWHSDCNYNGDFYCNHDMDYRPSTWVDFSFFHSTKKKYFAVAMITAEMAAYDIVEEEIFENLDPQKCEAECYTEIQETHPLYGKGFRIKCTDDCKSRAALARKKLDLLIETEMERTIEVSCDIDIVDYGPVAVGVHVTLNTSSINEHVIRDFISKFRSLGEPVEPGKIYGEKIKVVPANMQRTFNAKR